MLAAVSNLGQLLPVTVQDDLDLFILRLLTTQFYRLQRQSIQRAIIQIYATFSGAVNDAVIRKAAAAALPLSLRPSSNDGFSLVYNYDPFGFAQELRRAKIGPRRVEEGSLFGQKGGRRRALIVNYGVLTRSQLRQNFQFCRRTGLLFFFSTPSYSGKRRRRPHPELHLRGGKERKGVFANCSGHPAPASGSPLPVSAKNKYGVLFGKLVVLSPVGGVSAAGVYF